MVSNRKGIILAGGNGSRLYPITNVISKQLIPVYDKPMIYYPLSTLMLAGITEILIITNKKDIDIFKNLLGNGEDLGISIKYKFQEEPNGIAEAFLIAESFIDNKPSVLILGDNIFHGNQLSERLKKICSINNGATIFAYQVKDPGRYGIVEFDNSLKVLSIEEKPKHPKTNYALTGIYFYDETVVEKTKCLVPSKRGELEISDLNNLYLKENNLNVDILGRGIVWLDTGTPESLNEACNYISTIEHRQGLKISSPEEIAWRMNLIDSNQLKKLALKLNKSSYGKYLLDLLEKNF